MDISYLIRQAAGTTARFDPARPALAFEDGEPLSHADLAARTHAYANALLELGIRKGDRVALLRFNAVEYWLAYFAITRIGALAVRLNFRLGGDELEFVLRDSGAVALLADGELLDRVADRRDRLPLEHVVVAGGTAAQLAWAHPWDVLEAGAPEAPGVPLPQPDDPAMIMYTSGTTGRPKGAVWTHGTTCWWAAMQSIEWRMSPETVTMVTGPLYHVASLENFALPTLAAGGEVVVLRSRGFDLAQTLRIVERAGATDVLLFPTMLVQLAQAPDRHAFDLSNLRRIFTGGDPLLPWAVEFLREHYGWIDIVQVYGLTEGTPISVCSPPGFTHRRPTHVGKVFPFAEISIRDDDGARLPDGQTGEIWSRSPANARGYWRNEEATAATFVDGWCRTGDLGVVEDGALRIAGRKKDMIRSGGENVYPVEVEDVLLRHEAIADAAVIGVPDDALIEAVCAVVVVAEGRPLSEADVVAHCVAHLAGYKKPRRVEFVDEIPRTASGKVTKYVLRDRFGARSPSAAAHGGPRGD